MSGLEVISERSIALGESRGLAIQALDALKNVTTPDEAEALLARVKVAAEAARVMHMGKELSREWRNVELKAERRWGELLGKPERSRKPEVVTGRNDPPAERKAAHEARKIAAVPEPVFEKYVEQAEAPTKAGLLRAAVTDVTLPEPAPRSEPAEQTGMTPRQVKFVGNVLHKLDGMCTGLASVEAPRAIRTASEEQTTRWLAMSAQARRNLRQFENLIQQALLENAAGDTIALGLPAEAAR